MVGDTARLGAPIESTAPGGDPAGALFSIGKMVELLQPAYPDVTITSLRFLEREGLLTPQRTPGGHRLYGPRDVARVRRIKDLQRRRYSLEEIRQRLQDADEWTSLHSMTDEYLRLILVGDRAGALALVQHASDAGMHTQDLYLTVIAPAMTGLGELWQSARVTVAEEHVATAISRDVMAVLKERLGAAPPHGLRAVAACPAGELHELGLKMTADLFESAGWEVAYLGANTPQETLIDYMARRLPHLLLLSVGSAGGLRAAGDTIAAVRAQHERLGRVVIGVGGPAFLSMERVEQITGADFFASSADEAVLRAGEMVRRASQPDQ